jgi:endonuclease YncB( thermonuclease family)
MARITAILALALAVALTTAAPAAAQDRDCSDFGSQADAQNFYENAGPGDPHRLDADDDGRACDANPCPCRGPGGSEPPPPPPPPSRPPPTDRVQTIRAVVIRVIDGDTIVVRPLEETQRPSYTVRLLGIDSPERSPQECGSDLAMQSARELAPRGRRVLLKTDPTQPLFDRFDRLLAYVQLSNGPQLNRAQVTRGWAKAFVVGRRSQQHGSYQRAARRAKAQDRGAWGICGGMHVRG